MKLSTLSTIFLLSLFLSFFTPLLSNASTLSISPSSGTFSVGSTFNVSLLLDTKGKSINALQVFLSYPTDKLQIVSPSVGQSIIGVWTVSPKFNNSTGILDLRGGIPGGITASSGLLTNITFRVKAVGQAVIKYTDGSRVFLDDGKATDDLSQTNSAVYQFKLPPPQGPVVVSETHPDQSMWYSNSTATLLFANESAGVEGYSYIINDDPTTVPDNISEGIKQSVSYSGLSEGLHYFHIKSLRDGVWGGVTHFAIQVDTTPPAEFSLEILPSSRTSSTKPVVQFSTTDASSGFDHYELKLEPLGGEAVTSALSDKSKSFFIETSSPFIPDPLAIGSYNVVVRAYDKAGNLREVTNHLTITTPWFTFIGDKGLQIKNWFAISWVWVWASLGILLLILLYAAYRVWKWRHVVTRVHEEKKLPQEVEEQLAELKSYREKYGLKAVVMFFAIMTVLSFHSVKADTVTVAPPLITDLSRNISNKEIFYVGGKTNRINQDVVIYFQNLSTGETTGQTVGSDDNGDWFYRHSGFLSAGEYLLWAQSKDGDLLSPPSPQEQMTVKRTAIQFGSNRLSYETIYFIVIILLLIAIGMLVFFITYHYYHGRKKHKNFLREVREAEESIRRGFAVLRRDIEAELELVRKAATGETLSIEDKHKEAQLLQDLNLVQKRIGKEIWELKKESW